MKHTIPMFAAVVLFTACSGGDDAAKEKAAVTVEESALDASDDQDFILPQPISLASAFQDAGLTYKAGKTNPVTNKNKYAQNIDKLLNLGVYSTDLAYCAINNKSQEARTYLLAIQDLGSKVGMESVFSDKALIEKFDKNLSDKDALTELIYEIQDKSDAYLEDNDLKYLAAVQFAGAWAEGIYLGIDDSKKKGDLGTALVDQMVLLKNTIKALKKHPAKDDKRLQEVIGLFEDVLSTYEGLESVKKANKNINFEVPKLSTEEFDQLANKVTVLRNSIVSPSK
jgi:hypothetical protein